MSKYKIISTKDLKKKFDSGESFLLINVLSESSYQAIHIPGSINIDVGQPDFLEKIEKVTGKDKNKEIIVHCSSNTCQMSPAAARKLDEVGYTNITEFEEGLAGWKDAGYPLEGAMMD